MDNDASLVGVWAGGELIMKNGAITGDNGGRPYGDDWRQRIHHVWRRNTGDNIGGGADVRGSSVFAMSGAALYGQRRKRGGVGVEVWKGTFAMSGGAIMGNNGGGVDVRGLSVLTMSGGVIRATRTATRGCQRVVRVQHGRRQNTGRYRQRRFHQKHLRQTRTCGATSGRERR
jgi:hypothetical protein